jgi:hypothetical protein
MAQEAEPYWAVLELMGHVRLAGKISEEERRHLLKDKTLV